MKIDKPKVLLIHMSPEKTARIERLGQRHAFEAVPIRTQDENTPLGALAGAAGWLNALRMDELPDPMPVTEEMLVICGFNDRKLNTLLTALRNADLPVSLKAVLTEHNAVWSPRQLMGELAAERAAIAAADEKK